MSSLPVLPVPTHLILDWYIQMVDRGFCTPACLFGDPAPEVVACRCRCGERFHGSLRLAAEALPEVLISDLNSAFAAGCETTDPRVDPNPPEEAA